MYTSVLDGLHAERRRELMQAADRSRRTPLILAATAGRPSAGRLQHAHIGGLLARLLHHPPATI